MVVAWVAEMSRGVTLDVSGGVGVATGAVVATRSGVVLSPSVSMQPVSSISAALLGVGVVPAVGVSGGSVSSATGLVGVAPSLRMVGGEQYVAATGLGVSPGLGLVASETVASGFGLGVSPGLGSVGGVFVPAKQSLGVTPVVAHSGSGVNGRSVGLRSSYGWTYTGGSVSVAVQAGDFVVVHLYQGTQTDIPTAWCGGTAMTCMAGSWSNNQGGQFPIIRAYGMKITTAGTYSVSVPDGAGTWFAVMVFTGASTMSPLQWSYGWGTTASVSIASGSGHAAVGMFVTAGATNFASTISTSGQTLLYGDGSGGTGWWAPGAPNVTFGYTNTASCPWAAYAVDLAP